MKSISEVGKINGWKKIVPDAFYDWFRQRDTSFDEFMSIGNKQGENNTPIFSLNSLGVVSNRDDWVFNYAKDKMCKKLSEMIDFYNEEVDRYKRFCLETGTKPDVKTFVKKDLSKISWGGRSWRSSFARFEKQIFNSLELGVAIYRPFTKVWHYRSRNFNHSFYSIPQIFPVTSTQNKVICLSPSGNKGFSVLIIDKLPDLHLIGDTQCFPFYLYDGTANEVKNDLFSNAEEMPTLNRRDAITNEALLHFNTTYPNQTISKEDIFYYIYGLLHSEDYREKYADNLSKQLPRIPCVKTFADFSAFSQAGRDLAALHLNYETVAMSTSVQLTGNLGLSITPHKVVGGEDADFYVTKMKFAKKEDKTKVIYNGRITIENIPEEAYDYVVNGKPALEWVMERQAVTTDKDSRITNDANDWAIETMQNARYPLELFLRVITVSLETNKIVNGLPRLDI